VKRIIGAIVVVMFFALSAVMLLATPQQESGAGKAAQSLNVMGWKWAPGDEMERVMAKFTQDTGIKINLELMDYANYYQTLTARLQSSELDIAFAHAAPFFYPYADANLYYTNAELGVDTSFLIPNAVDQVTRNGKTWLVPGGINAMLLFTNNKMIVDNGWSYPNSWSDWMALNQKLVNKGIPVLDCSFQFNNTRYIWFPLEATKITHLEPDFWTKAKAGQIKPFEDPRWREIVLQIVDMWNRNYLNHDLSVVSNDVIMNTEFGEGRVAMMLSGTWSIGIMRDYQAKGLDYKAVMVPCNDAKYPTNVLPVVAAPGWGVNRRTTKFAAAQKFAQWWAAQVKSGYVGSEWGWPPPSASTPFKLFSDTKQDQIFGYFAGPAAPFTEVQMPSIEVIDTVDKQLQSIFTGQVTVDQALQNMQAKWEAVIKK
jgi:ABC-type glycerol-3-phosphate transport system substrate-binding protein